MKKTNVSLSNVSINTINNICAEFLSTDEIKEYVKTTFASFDISDDAKKQIIALNMLYELSKACSKHYVVTLNNERIESKQKDLQLNYAKISCASNRCTANVQYKIDSVKNLSCHINVTSKQNERFDVLNSATVKVSFKRRKDKSVANTRIAFKFPDSIDVLKNVFAILSEN